jgi:hypothetical protein
LQEFRSSGVQEFRSSGVQEFRSSGVQEFRSSGVQEFRTTAVEKKYPKVKGSDLTRVETTGFSRILCNSEHGRAQVALGIFTRASPWVAPELL